MPPFLCLTEGVPLRNKVLEGLPVLHVSTEIKTRMLTSYSFCSLEQMLLWLSPPDDTKGAGGQVAAPSGLSGAPRDNSSASATHWTEHARSKLALAEVPGKIHVYSGRDVYEIRPP